MIRLFRHFINLYTYLNFQPSTSTDKPICGDCYGAQTNETHCCNTCQDVIDAYRERRWQPDTDKFEQCKREHYVDKDGKGLALALNEGCRIYGYLEVNRVSKIF